MHAFQVKILHLFYLTLSYLGHLDEVCLVTYPISVAGGLGPKPQRQERYSIYIVSFAATFHNEKFAQIVN